MKYRIEADSRSWNLCKKQIAGENSKEVPPGTVTWGPFRYYANLEQAALGLLDQLIKDGVADRTDTQALIAAAQQATRDVIMAVGDLESRGIPASPQKAREAA